MAEERIDVGGGSMKISQGRYIYIYVPWEVYSLHKVGKWRVSGGQEKKGEEGRDGSYR